jgi:hypothetical protein
MGTISKRDRAQIPRRHFLFCFAAVLFAETGHTVRIRTGRIAAFLRHENRGKLGHSFRGILEEFSEGGWSYIREGTTTYCGMNFKVPNFSKFIQLYGLWHGFQDRFVWDSFVL